jgi:DNA-directed RNA polymerase subunit RPC12/RpoP
MQAKKAAELREEWGGKPCEHPALAKEYAEGKRTGDYVCTQCGARVTFRERAEILASRRQ